MTRKSARIFYFAQLMMVSTAILWLSLTEKPPQIQYAFWGWDKAQHAMAYAVFSFSAGRFFSLWNLEKKKVWGGAFVGAIAFGGLIEILQGLAGTGRTCDIKDLLADVVGALIVCCVVLAIHRKK